MKTARKMPRERNLGRWIDNYKVERLVACGGMGRVYLAKHRNSGQRVALKMIAPDGVTLDNLRRFDEEWRILSQIRHPRVVRFLDEGTTDDAMPYFVMEYIDGEPIDRYCRNLSLFQRLALIRSVCETVSYVHQQNVIHRDLKPENILVTTNGDVKLVDFGIAKHLSARSERATDTPCATPEYATPKYASPEQLAGEVGTPASDVYSLGALLCELADGCRGSDIRQDVEAVAAKALSVQPQHRYASAQELANEIGSQNRRVSDDVLRLAAE